MKTKIFYFAVFLILVGFLCAYALQSSTPEPKAPQVPQELDGLPVVQIIQGPEPALEEPLPEEDPPESVSRYGGISMTEQERQELAATVYLEAGNQTAEGQQAVAEVVLNRVLSPDFPGTVAEVLHQCEGTSMQQFATAGRLQKTEPPAAAYDAVDAAISGENVLPADVVYFSREGENGNVWGVIEDHVFCYGYGWKEGGAE